MSKYFFPTLNDSAGFRAGTNPNKDYPVPSLPSVKRSSQAQSKIDRLWNRDAFDSSVVPGPKTSGYYKGQPIQSFKKGGIVPKTGIYKLHKGETVIPADATYSQLLELGKSKDLNTRQQAVKALIAMRRNREKK